ncbi:MAG: alkaline phosphatase family protein [Pseudonocardiales bacterium]|nr:alkaline phosphatase family protein [Pseudonocardiales bacterium]MBV9031056.1 alkaline phosphatase family protein [Pseudonocardiales bacterium]MBW0009998.1 alkaline phosphatase family protein [Pseudonocardiales bacterium]
MRLPRRTTVLAAAVLSGALVAPAAAVADPSHQDGSRHVLLLSVDGLHQADLTWYVAHHPTSALAALVNRGVDFTHASTPVPSDSFPGMVAQATGGNPDTTGVYYDSSFNHALLPAGTTSCPAGAPTGADVEYAENLDRNPNSLDAGQGLSGLPGSILQLTSHPETLIDPAKLPVDPKTCKPVYPHQYLKVNTIFEVARAHDLRTAWSDKHPAYEILDGPSGTGVQDLFTPEINSQADGLPAGQDWTKDNAKTQQYDGYKAQAIRNEIDGFDHGRTTHVGVPAIFGMNFQAVSTAQKLPTSGGRPGGYLADGVTPGPVLAGALDFVDSQVGSFVNEIHARGLEGNTTIILSAKHGQSPTNPAALTRIPDGPLLAGLNTAWKNAHPGAGDLVAHSTDDDAMLLWLTDRSQAAAEFAKAFLLAQSGQGNGITGAPKPFTASGLATVFAGRAAARFFGVPAGDPRVPDLFGIVQHGVVYTGGTSKIAEHGGADPQDRNVPIVLSGAGVDDAGTLGEPVETTQIAPTILRLLGLNPSELQAVQREHTQALSD